MSTSQMAFLLLTASSGVARQLARATALALGFARQLARLLRRPRRQHAPPALGLSNHLRRDIGLPPIRDSGRRW